MAQPYEIRLSNATDQASHELKDGVRFINAVSNAAKYWDVEFKDIQAQLTERSAMHRSAVAKRRDYEPPASPTCKLSIDEDVTPQVNATETPLYKLAASFGFPYLSYECPYSDGDIEELLVTVIPGTERVWKNAVTRIYRQNHQMELSIVMSALDSHHKEQRKERAK